MQAETLKIAYFGKVPTHGDFVRRNASGTTMQTMDAWLQQALHFARTQFNQALDDAYGVLKPCPFFFAPRDADQVLVGVMGASRDSVGRKYPFLVAFEAEAAAFGIRRIVQIPVAYNSFFDRAAEIVREATAGRVDHHELAGRTEVLDTLVGSKVQAANFGHYLQQNTLKSFWERLWGYAGDSRKYLLFKNLLDILLPLRQGVPKGFPLVLRFPLGLDGRAPDFDATIWLEVCLRLLSFPALRPSFFWTLPEPGSGSAPFLLLSLGPPTTRLFSYLLPADDIDDDALCYLEHMGSENAALAALSIPARYGELLESEQMSLWDFLRRLSL